MNSQIKHYEDKLAYEIDSWDLNDFLLSGANIVIIDTRSKEAYEIEHIPSAVNFPHRDMTQESTKQLDKEATYVCYCDGIGCNASTKGALNLAKLGFKVKELIGGLDWWRRDGYDTEGEEGQKRSSASCGC